MSHIFSAEMEFPFLKQIYIMQIHIMQHFLSYRCLSTSDSFQFAAYRYEITGEVTVWCIVLVISAVCSPVEQYTFISHAFLSKCVMSVIPH